MQPYAFKKTKEVYLYIFIKEKAIEKKNKNNYGSLWEL